MLVRKLAKQISALRKKRGLTQEALAAKAGVSRGYLARLETGRHDPTVGTVEKLAKALRVKVAVLLK